MKSIRIKNLAIGLIILLIILILASQIYKGIFSNQSNTFRSDKYIVKGIDISHYQSTINWDMLANQDITFVYMKATEGITLQDKSYKTNYESARKTNIRIGSYHFYIFGASGSDQARHFINTAQCQSGDMIPAIDVEHSILNPYSTDSIFIASIRLELKVLENKLYEHYGVHPMLYTSTDFYNLYIKNFFPDNIIWISDLYNEPSDQIRNWRLWQFSHEGILSGLNEKVDLNYYRYSFREFKELLLP